MNMEFILTNWHLILSIIIAVYEAIVRIIPTVGNYSVLAKIIDILKWLSDYFNRKKK